MRTMKMMLVATLMTAACGEVRDPIENNTGSGSDTMGSDSGSGSDAGSGSNAMDTGALTIDSSDFVVQNNVWWTNTSGPTLHGTFQAPAGATVSVKIDNGTPINATLTGTTWAVSLPANTITSSSMAVVITLTDPSGSDIALAKTIGLDSAPPSISVQASTIHDERGDTIDFSTGEPIHTHVGPTIDLGGTCPIVYKYAYLMDASPTFGSSTSANDLAWKFRIDDAQLLAGSQQFRVRSDANAVLVPWTALPAPDAAGYSTVKLTRNGGAVPVASLGTHTGQFFIDVRATDWGNHSTTSSFCFENHPLAAPLLVKPYERGSLFDLSMANDAGITSMLSSAPPITVVKQHVIQQTAEPVTIAWSTSATAPAFSATEMYGYVEDLEGANWMCQPGNTDAKCALSTSSSYSPPAKETSSSGSLQHTTFAAVLRDDVSGQIVQTSTSTSISFTIPARTATEAPHSYSLEVTESGFAELMPPSQDFSTGFDTYTLMNLSYSGWGPWDLQGINCRTMTQTAFGPMCTTSVQYFAFTALDRATLTYEPFVATLSTGVDTQHLSAPSYVDASAMSTGPLNWDSGNNDLPGPF